MTAHGAGPQGIAPFSALHFSVHIGGTGARGDELGFCEVIFPPFAVPAQAAAAGGEAHDSHEAHDPTAAATPSRAPGTAQTLVLRRGFDGRLDLYRWWDQARRRQALRGRTVAVRLLDAQGREAGATWRFSHARPLLLAYSPLDALHGGVLIETLTLGFEAMSLRN